MVAEGDKVVARFSLRATHKGDYMGIPATNRPVHLTGTCVIRMEGCKPGEWWLEADFLGLLQQLGAIPAAG
jgi:predicted ester cyclase